jgi:hypothetical protein
VTGQVQTAEDQGAVAVAAAAAAGWVKVEILTISAKTFDKLAK